jgi:hypothetical protein
VDDVFEQRGEILVFKVFQLDVEMICRRPPWAFHQQVDDLLPLVSEVKQAPVSVGR